MKFTKTLTAAAIIAAGLAFSAQAAEKVKIAMVVKTLGNGFFDAAHQGADEAAKELGNVEIIFTGPAKATAEGQIELINSLVAQKVQAIVVSANDPDALVPATKKAMGRGIKVLSFDSGIAKDGRLFNLLPSSNALIGEKLVKMTVDAVGNSGEIAVLSATAQATNQNAWIEEMKKVLAKPEYKDLKLVTVAYGDDQTDKSYREAQGLFKSYPNLKAIIAPDHRRYRRRFQGRARCQPDRQGVRHGSRSAVRNGRPREERRGQVVRYLEPDRPRLLDHLRRASIRHGQGWQDRFAGSRRHRHAGRRWFRSDG